MKTNFYLSLIIIFIVGLAICTAGYEEGITMILFSYLSIFVYRVLIKILVKNKRFYNSLVEKLSIYKNLERNIVIFVLVSSFVCSILNAIILKSVLDYRFIIIGSGSFLAGLSILIHVYLLLRKIRIKEGL